MQTLPEGADTTVPGDDYMTTYPAWLNVLKGVAAGSHADLLTKVWGPEYRDDRDYLWAYVRHLRQASP